MTKRTSTTELLRRALPLAERREVAIYVFKHLPPMLSWKEGSYSRYLISLDTWKLWMLAQVSSELDLTINYRAELARRIAEVAQDGMIGIVETGRDCDCVDYTHQRASIPANVMAYLKLQDHTAKWADGPFTLHIVSPAEAAATHNESHDRVLEAFENGHPHHVISTYHG